MQHLTEHIKVLMEKLEFPARAVEAFCEEENFLDLNTDYAERFDGLVEEYMFPEASGLSLALMALDALAEEYGKNRFTVHFVFLLNCTQELLRRYRGRGIDAEIYWRTMDDLRCKLLECMECKGVPGTFVADWYDGFFALKRFALGRFQYEETVFNVEGGYVTAGGYRIEQGSKIINFHIPSSGIPLTDEVRLNSYKKAFDFYKDRFAGGPVVFCCGSWLLFPKHREFLPQSSNIIKFLNDFEIVSSAEKDNFGNGWRVFGRYADLPPEQLPRDTGLRRAYADWLTAGNKAGDAYGVIVFDGEKIIT